MIVNRSSSTVVLTNCVRLQMHVTFTWSFNFNFIVHAANEYEVERIALFMTFTMMAIANLLFLKVF